jgi:hypothetical protein
MHDLPDNFTGGLNFLNGKSRFACVEGHGIDITSCP